MTRRSAVVICIALAVCVALVPVLDLSAQAVLTPVWFVFAFVLLGHAEPGRSIGRTQSVALFSLGAPRAPPA